MQLCPPALPPTPHAKFVHPLYVRCSYLMLHNVPLLHTTNPILSHLQIHPSAIPVKNVRILFVGTCWHILEDMQLAWYTVLETHKSRARQETTGAKRFEMEQMLKHGRLHGFA